MVVRFDESLRERWFQADDGWSIDVPEGWGQGRSVFGGLTAALGVALAERQIAGDRRLRQVSLQLMRPTVAGPARGEVTVLREGKSTTFAQVTITQRGELTMQANLVYARARPAAMQLTAPRTWTGPGPDELIDLPYFAGMPDFLQHVQMRWASGGPPFSGAAEAHFTGYCRFREPAAGVEGLIALLDVWPCPSITMLEAPAPASTVSWSAHIAHAPELIDDFCAFEYRTIVGGDGYHTVSGRLHDPAGKLLAWTEQLYAVFA